MQESPAPQAPIRFSIVTAVYNVARYLDEFIESVESQTFPRDRFEVVVVNDGSTDDSPARLRAWEASRPGLVTVVDQANAGLPSARNAGLPLARGEWVTFADPDDRLTPTYLAEVDAFITRHPAARMIATRLMMLNDVTGTVADRHPLRRRFHQGNVLRYLDEHPDHFHGHVPTAFFPRSELLRQGLLFEPVLRHQFEDGHFCGHYLLGLDRPTIGFVASAEYEYRQRSDGLNLSATGRPERYTTVVRHGYLDLLRRGSEVTGRPEAPEWLQNFILYQLSWIYSSQETQGEAVYATVAPVADEFHDLVREILGHLSPDVITGFNVRTLKPIWIDILLHGYDAAPWHTPYAMLTQLDTDQQLVRVTYRYVGDPPVEEVLSGGRIVAPEHAKVRDLEYLGRVVMRERILWVTSRDTLRLRLNGTDIDLQSRGPRPWNRVLRPDQIRSALDPKEVRKRNRPPRRRFRDRLVGRLARTRLVRRYFGDAWVLMDRIDKAGDNAEHVFRRLRTSHPEINAWYVIENGTPDWRRLRAAGLGRMIPYGSLRWKLLMLNCRHLLASQIDWPIVKPPAIAKIRQPDWRYTYLGHGVTQRDLSSWLNQKRIDLLLSCTPGEHAAFVDDHTPYILTTKETRLTGMPRWDRLLEIDAEWPEERRDLLLISPTWRVPLAPLDAGSHRRGIAPEFLESEYARNWLAVLNSDALAEACEREGLRMGFLPHPNMQRVLEHLTLKPIVQPFTFAKDDVQELFARSAAFVTDYTSMAFDAAYINRPIVYFQFDLESLNSGDHFGRGGYFDYDRDGFGPVARTLEDVEAATLETLGIGRRPAPAYQARMDAAFGLRDGKCIERALDEIMRSVSLDPA